MGERALIITDDAGQTVSLADAMKAFETNAAEIATQLFDLKPARSPRLGAGASFLAMMGSDYAGKAADFAAARELASGRGFGTRRMRLRRVMRELASPTGGYPDWHGLAGLLDGSAYRKGAPDGLAEIADAAVELNWAADDLYRCVRSARLRG